MKIINNLSQIILMTDYNEYNSLTKIMNIKIKILTVSQ